MSTHTVVAVNLAQGQVGGGFGRARTLGLATVVDGEVTGWAEHEVAWDVAHDAGPEGTHHGRIVRFLREQQVDVVVTGHMGVPMQHTLNRLGVRMALGLTGDARAAAVAAASGAAPAVRVAPVGLTLLPGRP